jgi:hypothetical protein
MDAREKFRHPLSGVCIGCGEKVYFIFCDVTGTVMRLSPHEEGEYKVEPRYDGTPIAIPYDKGTMPLQLETAGVGRYRQHTKVCSAPRNKDGSLKRKAKSKRDRNAEAR